MGMFKRSFPLPDSQKLSAGVAEIGKTGDSVYSGKPRYMPQPSTTAASWASCFMNRPCQSSGQTQTRWNPCLLPRCLRRHFLERMNCRTCRKCRKQHPLVARGRMSTGSDSSRHQLCHPTSARASRRAGRLSCAGWVATAEVATCKATCLTATAMLTTLPY